MCTCIHIYKKKERKAGDLKLTKHNEREKIITNISQNTKKIVFAGTLCTKSKASFENGKVAILDQGITKKYVHQLQQITFSGKRAIEEGQEVVYITERCVFELRKDGLTLTEIAPGIDLERDILAQMEFVPIISDTLHEMPYQIFVEGPMNLFDYWETH